MRKGTEEEVLDSHYPFIRKVHSKEAARSLYYVNN